VQDSSAHEAKVRNCETHGWQFGKVVKKQIGYYTMKLKCGCVIGYRYSLDTTPKELMPLT